MTVFVGTAAWIALVNSRDGLHARADQQMRALKEQEARLVTTAFVLIELADALASPALRARTIAFINGLRQLDMLRILPLSDELLQDGWNLYTRRLDKEWGLTDCTSFAAMTQNGIARAFTSDHHFTQAGFDILL